MTEVATIGLDLAKNVCQAHGSGADGAWCSARSCGAIRCCASCRAVALHGRDEGVSRPASLESADQRNRPRGAADRARLPSSRA